MVIMFDWSIRFIDQQLARRIARAAVDQLGPADRAAVVFTSAFPHGGAPQNFTADRARLLAAINQRLRWPCTIRPWVPDTIRRPAGSAAARGRRSRRALRSR